LAFPYIFEESFEKGTKGAFNSETDTDSILDYPSYKTLAAHGWEPYSGAYCMRVVSPGATPADAFVTEADCNIADTETSWFRFNLFIPSSFDATANDTVALLELQGAADAETVAFGFRYVAATDVINLGIGGANDNAVPDTFSTNNFERDKWHTIELKVVIQTNGTGTVDMYVTPDGGVQATGAEASAATITNIAVTHAVLGLQDQDATTTGCILIDNFVQGAIGGGQLFHQVRYPETRLLTRSTATCDGAFHVFVGPGKIDTLTLLSGGAADNIVRVYDSDAASTADLVAEISNSIAAETVTRVTPIEVRKGAYCVLSGTAEVRALVKIAYAHYSAGAVRILGAKG
jgi:hypothetical protein